MKWKHVYKTFKSLMVEKDRAILAGLAVFGVFGTAALTVRATKKLIEKKDEIEAAETFKEKAIIVGKEVAAPAAAAVGTTACIIAEHHSGSKTINGLKKTIVTMKNAYDMSATAYETYQAIVEEKADPSLIADIKKAFAEKTHEQTVEKMKEKEVEKEEEKPLPRVIVDTGTGNEYFELDGILFKASREHVKDTFNDMDYEVRENYYVTVDELHNKLRIKSYNEEDEEVFTNLQWDSPNRGDRIKPVFTEIVDPTINATVNVISYEWPPRPSYR